MIIIGIIVSIVLFSIIVLMHEWGHFSTARFFGVRVEEFGLGIPPRAKKLFKDKKGTLYSLNWLPIGGFVKLTGEMPNTFLVYNEKKELYNNEDLEIDIENEKIIFDSKSQKISENDRKIILKSLKENKASYNLMNKPAWQQAIIILAGVFMNFLLASIIFAVLFFIGIKPIGINTKIETNLELKLIPTYQQALESGILIKNDGLILAPVKGSLAEKSNIKEGDIVYEIFTCETKINNYGNCEGGEISKSKKINNTDDFKKILSENIGKDIALFINLKVNTIENQKKIGINEKYSGGTFIKVNIPETGKIGAYIGENVELNKDFEYKYSAINAIKYGVSETYNQALLTFKGLGILVKKIVNPKTNTEREEALSEVSGPIGIVNFVSNSLSAGIIFIFILGAIISINLGVFNLLPIPALDGGRFIFITINGLIKKIFGKKAISEKTEGLIHVGFFVLLIALSIIIAYNDINKIISQ